MNQIALFRWWMAGVFVCLKNDRISMGINFLILSPIYFLFHEKYDDLVAE